MSERQQQQQQIDIQQVIQNLKDLNYITQRIMNDVGTKNTILESGLKECAQCQKLINFR